MALCGFLIAAAAGSLAYWLENRRLDAMVVDFAVDQARHLAHSLEGQPAEHVALGGAAREFLIARLELRGRLPVEVRRAGVTPALAAAFEQGVLRADGDHHENFRIDGHLYMLLSMPVGEKEMQATSAPQREARTSGKWRNR